MLLGTLSLALLGSTAALGEVAQQDGIRVAVSGSLSPRALPRHGSVPVSIAIGGKISSEPGRSPQLDQVRLELNSHGRIFTNGLPNCRYGQISPSTTSEALSECRQSLVGEGHFSADVKLPEQAPFPSEGQIFAFNGRYKGSPAILAHIYGSHPAPTSYVLPFVISAARGRYGTVLEASLPRVTGEWGFVTGISLLLDRSFIFRGHRHGYVSAGCPAPAGFPSAVFPLARTTFSFEGGPRLRMVLNRSCVVTG